MTLLVHTLSKACVRKVTTEKKELKKLEDWFLQIFSTVFVVTKKSFFIFDVNDLHVGRVAFKRFILQI